MKHVMVYGISGILIFWYPKLSGNTGIAGPNERINRGAMLYFC